MLAILCPGQGSQTAGFLAPWLTDHTVADRLTALSEAAGFDLVAAGTDPDADVVDTAVAQPLLVAAAVVTAELLGELPTCVVAGHSVGELAAAAVAQALSPADAVRLAARRGAAMARASAAADGGMTALLGGEHTRVLEAVEAAGCVAANVNGGGQVVAAGTHDALGRLADALPDGTRARPLAVAGPFHSPAMRPAQDDWAHDVAAARWRDVAHPIVSNLDGVAVSGGADVAQRLVQQVTASVRWDECIATMRRLGVTAVVELAPGGVLAGLVRRQLPEAEVIALRGPDDVARAGALIGEHIPHGEHVQADWRIITAQSRGTWHPAVATDQIGVVRTRAGDEIVSAAGTVVEWLALDGDPVSAGQPLARVRA